MRISNLNRIFPKFRKYPGKEILDGKSRVAACRFLLVNVCKGSDPMGYKSSSIGRRIDQQIAVTKKATQSCPFRVPDKLTGDQAAPQDRY